MGSSSEGRPLNTTRHFRLEALAFGNLKLLLSVSNTLKVLLSIGIGGLHGVLKYRQNDHEHGSSGRHGSSNKTGYKICILSSRPLGAMLRLALAVGRRFGTIYLCHFSPRKCVKFASLKI